MDEDEEDLDILKVGSPARYIPRALACLLQASRGVLTAGCSGL